MGLNERNAVNGAHAAGLDSADIDQAAIKELGSCAPRGCDREPHASGV
jgi:hypothetical protein